MLNLEKKVMKNRVNGTGYEVHLKNSFGKVIDFNDEMEEIAESVNAYEVNGCYADFGQDFQQAQVFVDYLESNTTYKSDLNLVVVYDNPDSTGNNVKLFKIA